MSAFQIALEKTLRHEGGFVNNPKDPGGATNMGISLRFLKSIRPGATVADIRAMTREQAAAIYQEHFWRAGSYDLLPQEISIKLFDLAVNMGPQAAHRCLQRALWAFGLVGLKDDGVIGGKTIGALRGLDVPTLLVALRCEAAGHYRELVARRPELGQFLNGWLGRAYYG